MGYSEFDLTNDQENRICWGVIGCIISIAAILVFSIHLIHYHFHYENFNKQILLSQLLGFFLFLISCVSYSFIRTNIFYGGINNKLNYNPMVSEPFGWICTFFGYIAGKLSTDISWIIKTYATFKVMFYSFQYKFVEKM